MKATAILRDFAESFFTGIIRYSDGSVSSVKGVGFDLMDAREKWEYCLKESVAYGSGKPRIPVKATWDYIHGVGRSVAAGNKEPRCSRTATV